MIRALKAFADWLDKRFPAKVTITEAKLAEFEFRLHRADKNSSGFQTDFMLAAARIASLEDSVRALKDLIAKGGATAVKTEKEVLRDQFVRGEFSRGPGPVAHE